MNKPKTLKIITKFAESWKSWSKANNIKIGILFIPSKERVVYEYFKRKDELDLTDKEFIYHVNKQIDLERRSSMLFDKYQIPYVFSLEYTTDSFTRSIKTGKQFYPEYNNGHPFEDGYQSYALAAYDLWKILNE